MVTRSDVARLAGTSPAVVSYVLNNGPRGVAPATKERVLRAVEQLGYRPNQIAASLRNSQTKTLGLVVPDNANPYFAELAREVEEVAFAAGYTLFLGNATDDAERESAYVRAFLDRRVDGLILIPSHDMVPSALELSRAGTPWVILDRGLDAPGVPAQVRSDNRLGGRLATEHLTEHGRRLIACISGPRDVRATNERVLGWRDALVAAGLDVDAAPLREIPFGRFAAHAATLDLLTRNPGVDALFVASDEQALGAIRALSELGRRCPDDVALVSFDGIDAALLTTPGVTTVRQPVERIAQTAVELLLAQREPTFAPSAPVILPVELVVRGSCGCPDTPYAPRTRQAGSPQ